MAGDKHVLTFFWFQRFVAFICMLEQIISSNGKYSIVSILFLLDMKYVGMLSVALCLDRGLSLIMSPGIWHCQGLWFLVSYNYFHRFLDILSWLISTSFYLNRLLGSSTVAFIVFVDLDWGGGGYCHLYGLYGYVLLWGTWMGKWIRRVMHACKLSQVPIQCQCSLIMGLFFLLSLITRVWKGWGSWSFLPASHTIFHHFLSPPHPPWVWGLGRHITFQIRVLSFVSKVHSLKQD